MPMSDKATVAQPPDRGNTIRPPQPDAEVWEPEYDELPPRPRRRLTTPVNLGLLAVLLLALGFIGGVLVEKGQTRATGGRTATRGAAAGTGTARTGAAVAARASGGTGTGTATATVGTVSTVDGHTLFVTDAQGNTIKVTSASGGTVTRTALASVPAIHPGDTVIAQGPKNSDGSVSATSIRATAANAALGGGLAGLLGGGGGGGASASGGRSGGAAAGGGSSSGSPTLFGPG